MIHLFHTDQPFWRFAVIVLTLSLLGMAPPLVLFVLSTPGFARLLATNGDALVLVLRQVLINGLPVVLVLNYSAFFLLGLVGAGRISPRQVLLVEPPLRAVLFILLHAVIYALSADWFGSFGGDSQLALTVVAPTLLRSAAFQNISGVYLYSTLVSALPLHAVVLRQAGWSPLLAPIPFAVSVALVTGLCALLA